MKRTLTLAVASALWVGAAHADQFTDAIVANLRDLGYDFIEIQNGLDQVKVEAVRGSDKLEVVYDRTSGAILKQERERAEASEVNRTGVQVRDRNRNFLDVGPIAALADSSMADDVVARLQADGYQFIEVKNGLTQIKVEAVRGNEKLELIFDRETGEVLKRETESAGNDAGRTGLEISSRARDFVDSSDGGRRDDESDDERDDDQRDDDERDYDERDDDEDDDDSDERDDDEDDDRDERDDDEDDDEDDEDDD